MSSARKQEYPNMTAKKSKKSLANDENSKIKTKISKKKQKSDTKQHDQFKDPIHKTIKKKKKTKNDESKVKTKKSKDTKKELIVNPKGKKVSKKAKKATKTKKSYRELTGETENDSAQYVGKEQENAEMPDCTSRGYCEQSLTDLSHHVEPVEEKSEELNQPQPAAVKKAFRRVADEDWLDKKGSWNNSFAANFGSSGWGAKAQAVLGQVKGKSFRHEKTKKKRGTYFGGKISTEAVNSIKFDSDDN